MNLSATTFSHTGTKKDSLKLSEKIFGVSVHPQLLSQAVRVYLSNQRQGTKFVQGRSDVDRTTAKVWKQKGTGRARHGSRKAPIFVGGGQAHGPSGIENYSLTLTKRMRRQAILGALTHQQQQSQISILEDIDQIEAKTKVMSQLVSKIKPDAQKVLFILDQPYPNVLRAITNLPGIMATQAKRLNVYEVLNFQHLIISKAALSILESTYATGESKQTAQDPQPTTPAKSTKVQKPAATKEAASTKPATKKPKSTKKAE